MTRARVLRGRLIAAMRTRLTYVMESSRQRA